MEIDSSWINNLFIEKGEIFLKILDYMWGRAERDVDNIIKLFDKYGVDKEDDILEIGCGNGRILINLAKRGYKNLYGVDISNILIEDALKRHFNIMSLG